MDKWRLRTIRSGVLLALAAVGCRDADAPSGAETSDAEASIADARWTIMEEMRIGAGDGPEQFGQIKGLVVLADGRFAALDSQAHEIRVFAADGSHVATWGRRGEGPGEMEWPNGLMLGHDGLLWVPDVRNVRMSLFHPDSGFARALPYGSNLTEWAWSGAMGADGRVFAPGLARETRADVLVVYDSTMTAVDSLPMEEPSEESDGSYCWSPSEGVTNCRSVPFYASAMRFIDPEGHVWERASGVADYRIRKWAPGGDTVLVVTGERQPLPVSSAEREAAIAELREEMGKQANPDLSRIPSAKPVVQALFMSDEGNLWVKFASPGAQAAFDVWTPDGAHLGAAVSDIRFHISEVAPVVRGDQVWLVANDELETEYVVRARLVEVGGR